MTSIVKYWNKRLNSSFCILKDNGVINDNRFFKNKSYKIPEDLIKILEDYDLGGEISKVNKECYNKLKKMKLLIEGEKEFITTPLIRKYIIN